jgi:hypothetical protein
MQLAARALVVCVLPTTAAATAVATRPARQMRFDLCCMTSLLRWGLRSSATLCPLVLKRVRGIPEIAEDQAKPVRRIPEIAEDRRKPVSDAMSGISRMTTPVRSGTIER